jgi:hypothetical protein
MMTEFAVESAPSSSADEKIRFVGSDLQKSLLRKCEAEGWLPVCVEIPGAQSRGRLGLVLEEAIERSLEARGACPPGIGASADSDASLSDQLYRARLLGAPGLALAVERLESIANRAGALDAEDSAVLRWGVMTARERPLRLYFNANDRNLGVYTAPTSFWELVQDSTDYETSVAPPVNEELASNLMSMQAIMAYASRVEPTPAIAERPADELVPTCEPIETAPDASLASGPTEMEPSSGVVNAQEFRPDALLESDASDCSKVIGEAATSDTPPPPTPVRESLLTRIEKAMERVTETHFEAHAGSPELREPEPEARPALDTRHPQADERWRDWMRQLEQARGPKPLALVEQLFVNAYVPLADAAARGIASPEAFEVLSTWSASFAHSYGDAFDALRLRGKRPLMVLDVVDVSIRLARLHGARAAQLVLVDGLRFDLGLRVEERMRAGLNQQAAMTERLVLWSALPSTTSVQLDLIARGAEGLKNFEPASDENDFVAHGRAASTLRRVRAGNREVLKLDLVESRLNEPGIGSPQKLDELADAVSQTLCNSMLKFPPRTLVMVFGDHGFAVDPKAAATAKPRHGGASPDEILVPAIAWLVGATH